MLLRLVDRGQYSKNEHLSETVAAATSFLSYLEPSLVFPFVASRFNMALETVCMMHIIAALPTFGLNKEVIFYFYVLTSFLKFFV